MTIKESEPRRSMLYLFTLLAILPTLLYGLLAAGVILAHLSSPSGGFDPFFKLLMIFVGVPMNLVVGYLVIRHAPGNVIGPLLILFGISILSWLVNDEQSIEIENAVRPFFGTFAFWAILCLIVFFPTGRTYFRRIELLVEVIAILYIIGGYVGFLTERERHLPGSALAMPNPTYIPAIAPLQNLSNLIVGPAFMILLLVGIVSIIPRYRGSNLSERQQMKWLAFGFAGFVLGLIIWLAVGVDNPTGGIFGSVFLLWCYMFPAIAVGNAILRHRLYDIDIIIRRTLIYSILTAILATIYFLGVVITQQVFKAITGQGSEPAVIVSTLLIAALFTPLRRRVQNAIDRRLYRRKYDAEQTLAQFSQSLRDEVDLETLQTQLVGVVQDTMQPKYVTLWLRDPAKLK